MPEPVSDETLIARCLQHDEEAWRLLVGRYASYIYSIARRGYQLEAEDASEVFQESLIKVLEGLRGYRREGPLRAWVRQIVRNCCAAHIRRGHPTEPLEETLPDRQQEAILERIEHAYAIAEAVRSLDESCQQIISLFFYQGHSYKMIAASLGISEGTVGSRLARCMTKLRSRAYELL